MQIVDAHLDLAYNALRGRDVLKPAIQQKTDEDGTPSVGLPDLHAGGVGLIVATVYCSPGVGGRNGYRNPQEAHDAGMAQLAWYRQREADGSMSIVRSRDGLLTREATAGRPLRAVILLEGADPLRSPEDVEPFFNAGMRMVGLAWRQTRYAGGTGAPGPLTAEGVAIIPHLDRFGVIHDTSHLAEESFWQLLDLTGGPIVATHSNCRAFVPTDRQLSDEMIRAIAKRGGVIGINFCDRFLIPPEQFGKRRANLRDVVRHVQHMCQLTGGHEHVGIGTDLDGGFGAERIPEEILTAADLPKVADALSSAGFSDDAVLAIMGENWIRLFSRVL